MSELQSKFIDKTGVRLKFDTNAAVLLSNSGEPIGTRIFGPVVRELRLKNL